jgi:hypothetical protein
MESLKEYRPSIINKLKLFLSRIEQRKTIEKNLDKLDISLFSSNNIDYIIQNKEKFKSTSGMPEPQKEIMTIEDKLGIVMDFFHDLNSSLGKKVEDTYLKYKTQIYFDECSDKNKEIGDGFTSGHNISTSIMCGDGIERPNLIARICTNKNNALDIYNIAHEFTHILLNENTKGKNISAENQEIATRFTEILLGEYMEKRKIITTEDKENHNICISGEIDKAYQLNEYRILRNLIKNNGNKFDKKLERMCISKYCKGNKNWYYQILSNIAYRLERTGKVDGFQNYLRFVNSAAECDRLKQAYIENPDLIKKAFSQCLMSHHSITYNDVVKKMDTIKYEDRAKLNIASKGRDEVEEQDIIR